MLSELVGGPAVEAAALALFTPGNGGVLVMPVTQGVAGSNGSDHGGARPGRHDRRASVTGTPKDDYDVIIKFMTGVVDFAVSPGNAAGTLQLQPRRWPHVVSHVRARDERDERQLRHPRDRAHLHAGRTVRPRRRSPWDTYSWHSTGPGFTSSNLSDAFDALLAKPDAWNFVHVVGRATNAPDRPRSPASSTRR
jgi:hypothetical protein